MFVCGWMVCPLSFGTRKSNFANGIFCGNISHICQFEANFICELSPRSTNWTNTRMMGMWLWVVWGISRRNHIHVQILKDEPCHFPVGGHLQIPQRLQRQNYVAIQLLTFESIEECNIGHYHDKIIFSSTVTQQLPYPPWQLMPACMSVKTMQTVLGHAEFIIIPLQSLAL